MRLSCTLSQDASSSKRRGGRGPAGRRQHGPCPSRATTACSMSRRRPALIVRNGSGGNAGVSSPRRSPSGSSGPHARQRNSENTPLSRRITGRTQPASAHGDRRADDDRRARISMAGGLSLSAQIWLRRFGSTPDSRCRAPSPPARSAHTANGHDSPSAATRNVR